jgi:hypothetical protein
LLSLLNKRINLLFGSIRARAPSRIRKLGAWEIVLTISLDGFKELSVVHINY